MALFKRDVAKKGLSINQGLRQQITGLESQQLAPELLQANQEAQMMKNRGLTSSALGLFKQQVDRSQAAAMSQLGGRRSGLAGIGAIVQGGQDAGLKLANLEEEAKAANRQQAMSSAMGLGKEKMGLQRYKQEGLFNYYMGRKQARQAQLNSIINAGVTLGAAALGGPLAMGKKSSTTTTG